MNVKETIGGLEPIGEYFLCNATDDFPGDIYTQYIQNIRDAIALITQQQEEITHWKEQYAIDTAWIKEHQQKSIAQQEVYVRRGYILEDSDGQKD